MLRVSENIYSTLQVANLATAYGERARASLHYSLILLGSEDALFRTMSAGPACVPVREKSERILRKI